MTAIVALTLSIVLTLVSQLAQKQVADDVQREAPPAQSMLMASLTRPMFWFAMVCLGVAMLAWLVVLGQLDVGKAYPLLGLNYVLVPLAGRVIFHEPVPPLRWIGIAVILAGVIVISGS
jgi:undecaprenyl phosphate-alpha-L-ara4N flippase subunit ArnE